MAGGTPALPALGRMPLINAINFEVEVSFANVCSPVTHLKSMRHGDAKHWVRPRVGLALSGGAARGMAHVGVLKALTEHNVPIDCVAGTSAGALVGGAFAAGASVAEIAEYGRTMRWRDFG